MSGGSVRARLSRLERAASEACEAWNDQPAHRTQEWEDFMQARIDVLGEALNETSDKERQ